jgi:hypothetical protein
LPIAPAGYGERSPVPENISPELSDSNRRKRLLDERLDRWRKQDVVPRKYAPGRHERGERGNLVPFRGFRERSAGCSAAT